MVTHPTRVAALTTALALATALPASADPIVEAISADITEAGLEFVIGEVTTFLPPDLVIGSIPGQNIIDVFECSSTVFMHNLVLHTLVEDILVHADEDALTLELNIWLWVNEEAAQADVDIISTGFFCGAFDYACDLYTDPARMSISIPLTLTLGVNDAGEEALLMDAGDLQHNIQEALANEIHLTGCAVGEINEFLSDYLGLNIFDLVVATIIGDVETQITDAITSLEETVAAESPALWLADSIDLLGSALEYAVEPSAVHHEDEGLRIVMQGELLAETGRCVEPFLEAFPGPATTSSALPDMTATIPGSEDEYHAGLLLSDDFGNQAMYEIWRSGAMCFLIDDIPTLGLTTELLPLLLGSAGNTEEDLLIQARLAELFPLGEQPMLLRTLPAAPPDLSFDGPNDINISAPALGIEFYAWMQDRFTRLATVTIDVGAGLDIEIDSLGSLSLGVDLDLDAMNPRVTYNEIAPDLNDRLENNFPSFLAFAIDNFAGSLLEGITFAMPTFGATGDDDDSAGGDDDDSAGPGEPSLGLGLVSLDFMAGGDLLDWLAGYALLGQTTGGVTSGGCEDCAGEGGCTDCAGEGGACGGCEDAGCADLDGCLDEQGCTGEASQQPVDVGCTACGFTAVQTLRGKWRVTVDDNGTQIVRRRVVVRAHPSQALWVLPLVVFLGRRRRSRFEA